MGYNFLIGDILESCKVHRRAAFVAGNVGDSFHPASRRHCPPARLPSAFGPHAGVGRPPPAAQLACFLLFPRCQINGAVPCGTRPAEEFELKKIPWLCMIALAGAFAGNAEAIYKCTTPKGVIYQDRPCREGKESDVLIVIPTGELAPAPDAAQDSAAPANAPRGDNYFGAPKPVRGSDAPSTGAAGARQGAAQGVGPAADDSRKSDARGVAEKTVPMTADQARQTEPSGKYYSTDAVAPGTEMPEQMTCESPNGVKRQFILANGKLTSI